MFNTGKQHKTVQLDYGNLFSSNGGMTWVGQCVNDINSAIDLLENGYMPKGLCGCLTCEQAVNTEPVSLVGQIVGTGMNVCEIISGDERCPYYVQYR